MPGIKLLFGPMLLGTFINMILYGVLIMQCYHYYQTFKKDTPWIKILVLYLFIVESVNTGCDIAMMYQPLIERFGTPEATKYFPTMFAAEPVAIVLVSMPIQLFFAWRIFLLTKSKALALLITLLAVVSFAGGIWTTERLVAIKVFARKPELHTPALVWFLSACIADVLITISLVLTLSSKKTGFVATDDAISKIIRMTVQTGMLTAFFAVGDVVFFMTLGKTALNFIWDLALSKLYANCLLSTLNARISIQELSSHHLSQQRNMVSTGGIRRPDQTMTIEGNPAHIISSSMYELETRKSFDHSDMEYGITITKVVETRQDPQPHMRDSTQ